MKISRFTAIWIATCENVLTGKCVQWRLSLRIHGVYSESSLFAWRNVASFTIQNGASEDSDQTVRMHRLIWIFAGRKCPNVLPWCCDSYMSLVTAASIPVPDFVHKHRISVILFLRFIQCVNIGKLCMIWSEYMRSLVEAYAVSMWR